MAKIICFDLEGPLSPSDNAFEVMGLLEGGHEIFACISRYDDLLALEGKENYEPGDTLKLIVPFLCRASIREKDVKEISEKAKIVKGACELVEKLQGEKWQVYLISTSYEQHAYNIADQIGVEREKVACTKFPLNRFSEEITRWDLIDEVWDGLEGIIEKLLSDDKIKEIERGGADDEIKSLLDWFYWGEIPETSDLSSIFKELEVMGGRRKVKAAEIFARNRGCTLSDIAVVGDSITDFQMLKAVEAAGGLSIVFNGNAYALPYGTVGLASTRLDDLWLLLCAWQTGGREAAKEYVEGASTIREDGPYFHWLVGKYPPLIDKKDEILKIHKKIKGIVRKEAAPLG